MRIVGLTGSIGMGKSTTARMFAAHGVPVHDADAAVRRLYAGAAVEPVEAAFPGVTVDGGIDRQRLAERVVGDPGALALLEAIVHPLVQEEERRILEAARRRNTRLAVLDIPLLFETGGEARVDLTVVVTAPADIQLARVLTRPGMSEEKLASLLRRQLPDLEKRKRAHFLVDTGRGMRAAERQVAAILRALAAMT
ncbi:MAG TPA: dephospho-CoA kinase [Afifellaceae bacterium]|nr:dephospho-CoA kinase [Afifellaceae bacterium]